MEEAQEVLNTTTPQAAKAIGNRICRAMQGPLHLEWRKMAVHIMEALAILKFRDPELLEEMCKTGTATLVEASPDTYWGAGKNLTQLRNGARITGQNVLGEILMKVRCWRQGDTIPGVRSF